jgi:tetratricopeptide (TPR) repeat protein
MQVIEERRHPGEVKAVSGEEEERRYLATTIETLSGAGLVQTFGPRAPVPPVPSIVMMFESGLDASPGIGAQVGALLTADQALRVYRGLPDPAVRARSLRDLGEMYRSVGRHTDAVETYREAWTSYRLVSDASARAAGVANTGAEFVRLRRSVEATEAFEEALELYRQAHDRLGEGRVLSNLGVISLQRGDHANAERFWRLALRVLPNKSLEHIAVSDWLRPPAR